MTLEAAVDRRSWVDVPLVLPVVLGAAGLAASLLLIPGWFHWWLFLPLAAALSVLAVRWAPVAGQGQRGHGIAAAAFAGVWAVWTSVQHSQLYAIERDPAVYQVTAGWLVDHASPWIPVDQRWEAISGVDPGFLAYFEQGGQLAPQGAHSLPALAAVLGWAHPSALALASPLIGAVALLAVYALARELVGPRWAWIPMVALAATASLSAFSRGLYTEPTALALGCAGLAALWRAWPRARLGPMAVAGALLAGPALVRIDGLLGFALAAPVVALGAQRLPAGRRLPSLGAFAAAGALVVVVGAVETRVNSPGYWADLATQRRQLLLAIVVSVLVSAAAPWLVAIWASLRPRVRAAAVPALMAGLVLGYAVLALRPLWMEARQEVGLPYVEALQRLEGLEVDGTRTYAEQSVAWLSWYLGAGALLLGLAAFVVWSGSALRRRDVPMGALAAVANGFTLLYLVNPSIVPDHVWASRRFLAVTFSLLLLGASWLAHAATLALTEALAARVSAQAARVGSAVAFAGISVVLVLPAGLVLAPVASTRIGVPQKALLDGLCQAIDGRAVLTVKYDLGFYWGPPIRALCPAPAASVTAFDAGTWGEVAAAFDQGAVAVVADPALATWTSPPSGPTLSATTTDWQPRLSGPAREQAASPRSLWVGVIGSDGRLTHVPAR